MRNLKKIIERSNKKTKKNNSPKDDEAQTVRQYNCRKTNTCEEGKCLTKSLIYHNIAAKTTLDERRTHLNPDIAAT